MAVQLTGNQLCQSWNADCFTASFPLPQHRPLPAGIWIQTAYGGSTQV
ncbi:hypothetical protein KBY81_16475 [Cyanobium sp. Lug-B]|nr:hypothetical protein [Cyanobium sp. Lug-B]